MQRIPQHDCFDESHHLVPNAAHHLILEAPHAASTAQWSFWRQWCPEPWEGMDDLFWCTTDQGITELLGVMMGQLRQRWPGLSVSVIRGLIPRTFGDLNRQWSTHARPGPRHTGALAPQLTSAQHVEALTHVIEQYHQRVTSLLDNAAQTSRVIYMQCHTYAPITVRTRPGQRPHLALRRAYGENQVGRYPKRPKMQLMTAPSDDRQARLSNSRWVEGIIKHYQSVAVDVSENQPFALHPLTRLTERVTQWAPAALGVEWSRASLAERYLPFDVMHFDDENLRQWSAPMVDALAYVLVEQ